MSLACGIATQLRGGLVLGYEGREGDEGEFIDQSGLAAVATVRSRRVRLALASRERWVGVEGVGGVEGVMGM